MSSHYLLVSPRHSFLLLVFFSCKSDQPLSCGESALHRTAAPTGRHQSNSLRGKENMVGFLTSKTKFDSMNLRERNLLLVKQCNPAESASSLISRARIPIARCKCSSKVAGENRWSRSLLHGREDGGCLCKQFDFSSIANRVAVVDSLEYREQTLFWDMADCKARFRAKKSREELSSASSPCVGVVTVGMVGGCLAFMCCRVGTRANGRELFV